MNKGEKTSRIGRLRILHGGQKPSQRIQRVEKDGAFSCTLML